MLKLESFSLAGLGFFLIAPHAYAESAPFEEARIFIEQNSTDGDEEVVIIVHTGEKGLKRFSVFTPNGAKIIDVNMEDASTVGLSEFLFETPEPALAELHQLGYPQGIYIIKGEAADGSKFESSVPLSHLMPMAPDLEADINEGLLHLAWTPSADADHYIVEFENDESGFSMTVTLPGNAESFDMPADKFIGTGNFEIGLGRANQYGNINVSEIEIVIP